MPRSSPVTPDPGELPFEEALSRLEKVVDRLEQGDLELEGSLEAFEEGVKLSRRCASQLESAEQRIWTFPAYAPMRALDSIYVRGDIRIERMFASRAAIARQASDHLPLVAELSIVPF